MLQAIARRQQHMALSRSRWECLGQFVYGRFALSEVLGEASGLC